MVSFYQLFCNIAFLALLLPNIKYSLLHNACLTPWFATNIWVWMETSYSKYSQHHLLPFSISFSRKGFADIWEAGEESGYSWHKSQRTFVCLSYALISTDLVKNVLNFFLFILLISIASITMTAMCFNGRKLKHIMQAANQMQEQTEEFCTESSVSLRSCFDRQFLFPQGKKDVLFVSNSLFPCKRKHEIIFLCWDVLFIFLLVAAKADDV